MSGAPSASRWRTGARCSSRWASATSVRCSNSGNAVFDAPARDVSLAARIQRAIAAELSVETQVLVRTAGQVAAVVDGNELSALASDPSRMLVIFSDQPSRLAKARRRSARRSPRDVLHVGRHAAYLWCPNGLAREPARRRLRWVASERAATTRNWAHRAQVARDAGDEPDEKSLCRRTNGRNVG